MPPRRPSKPPSARTLLSDEERHFLQIIVRLASANPWLPARIQAERAALGDDFVEVGPVMTNQGAPNENVRRIGLRLRPLLERLREHLAAGVSASAADLALYQDACLYALYDAFDARLDALLQQGDVRVALYPTFLEEYHRLLGVSGGLAAPLTPEHLFACFYQLRRAYHYLYTCVLGSSLRSASLRASVWESIFTADLRAYQNGLYDVVKDVPTLILGPTGTGKELVAQAIGLSRYLPFDAKSRRFAGKHDACYHQLNVSALSPSLIESELFGHARGAFTGAVGEKRGWLSLVAEGGTLFLDEIGDVEPMIQVKLLRVLEKRVFQRLGDTETLAFSGRILAATHRDLPALMSAGKFREDLYFRLCGHVILTPSLHEQLDGSPGELSRMVRRLAAKMVPDAFAEHLAERAERWITTELPADYPWPGNVRELEQCLRHIMMCGAYHPPVRRAPAAFVKRSGDDFYRKFEEGTLTMDEIERRYVTFVQARTGSYRETGKRTGLTRRTLAEKIDAGLLAELLEERGGEGETR